jgi:hypothetical protein
MLKVMGAYKLGKDSGLILYHDTKENLYYAYLYSMGLMLYGNSIEQSLNETIQVLREYQEFIEKGKLNPVTLLKEEKLTKTIQLYWGLLKAKIFSYFNNKKNSSHFLLHH